jgi:hypothetical protein
MVVPVKPGDIVCTLARKPTADEQPRLIAALRLMMAAASMRSVYRTTTKAHDSSHYEWFEDSFYPILSMIGMAAEAIKMLRSDAFHDLHSCNLPFDRTELRDLYAECIKHPLSGAPQELCRVRNRMTAHHDDRVAREWIVKMTEDPTKVHGLPIYVATPGENLGRDQRFPWTWLAYLADLGRHDDIQNLDDLKQHLGKLWVLSCKVLLVIETILAHMMIDLPVECRPCPAPIASTET